MQKGNGEHAIDLSHSISRSGSRILLLEEEDAIISKCCIFRIPGMLKMQNEQAYTPYRFSIGPWHFGKTQLMSKAQKFGKAFLCGLILLFPDPAAKKKELEEAIKEAHSKAKECYELEDVCGGDQDIQEGVIDAAKENFEEILLLDGCFIIEFFRKNAGKVPIYMKMILDQPQTLAELLSSGSKIVHLVDLARRYLCYSSNKKVDDLQSQCTNTIPSATRLKEAGVKFKKAMSGNIFDVKFHKGVLEIPPLQINPLTETTFRNLISFEQCRPFCIPKVTCYAMLLDCLVDTSDDVDLMSKAGIFDNWLNSEEAAKFLTRMRNSTPTNNLFYAQLFEDVNAYCLKCWPKWQAALIQNYFTKPWAIVSVIFAITVLFFTIMQVFYK